MALARTVTLFLWGVAIAFGTHGATAIRYQVVDLPDATLGVDEMKYVYRVDGAIDAFHGFNLVFDPTRYANLSIITPLGADWDQVVYPPDAAVQLDGLVSSMALTSISNASGTFEVGFTRIGVQAPGAQAVEFFDDSFNIVDTASTTAFVSGIPEPSTYVLMGLGLATVLALARRRSTLAPLLSPPLARA